MFFGSPWGEGGWGIPPGGEYMLQSAKQLHGKDRKLRNNWVASLRKLFRVISQFIKKLVRVRNNCVFDSEAISAKQLRFPFPIHSMLKCEKVFSLTNFYIL